MNLYSGYRFYGLLDQLPEVTRRNPDDIRDGWTWGDFELYPQFDHEEYYPQVSHLLQQAIMRRCWLFCIVSPLPSFPNFYFATVCKYEDTKRVELGFGVANDLCTALLVAYVMALEKSEIIKGSEA
jgi:hypothetical protein